MRSSLFTLLGLAGLSVASPAELIRRDDSDADIQRTCSKYLAETTCYTATTTVAPSKCPIYNCPKEPAHVCPLYIKVTSIEVPCSTNCCPKTPTVTKTKACPSCTTGCVIPTETITVTTGCPITYPTKPTPVPY